MTITSAFGYRSTALEVAEGHDLHAKTVIVTGAASGIGVETARAFASRGADVTLAVRNTAAGNATAEELRREYPSATVHVLELDLSSLASVHTASSQFLDRGRPLDILVNNAGVMATPFARTVDGFETQFGTNHLGHFAFTLALIDPLRRSGNARVVALSSSAHRRSDLNREDPNYHARPYDPWESYGQSKTSNSLFALELTTRYAGDGVFSNAVMPGGIMTNLQRHMSDEDRRKSGFVDEEGNPNPLFKTPEQGASTSVWAALGAELDGVGGLYLENCAQAGPMDPDVPYFGYMPWALDPETSDFLWTLSEQLMKDR